MRAKERLAPGRMPLSLRQYYFRRGNKKRGIIPRFFLTMCFKMNEESCSRGVAFKMNGCVMPRRDTVAYRQAQSNALLFSGKEGRSDFFS